MTYFLDANIERIDKESEEVIAKEPIAFIGQPLAYLKQHKNEFIYLESKAFEPAGVEAVSIEADDVFGTYDVMLGLKLQKKWGHLIKEELNNSLMGNEAKFDLLFSHDDGLWDLNFTLNFVKEFREEMTLGEAFELINQFLLNLVQKVKG